MSIDSLPPLREVIAAHGLRAKKELGQNFLLDLNLTSRIARAAGRLEGYTIIEVGPGPGGLTRALLAEGASKVIAIERDERALPALAEIAAAYPGKLEVISADALEVDYAALTDGPTKIVANLPYNIATPLLTGWLTADPWPPFWDSLTLMFQKEVAERICAGPGSKAYGRLGVLAGWRTHAHIAFNVDKSAFTPPPKVTSSIVHLEPKANAAIVPVPVLEEVTKAAFGQRRKMVRQSLKGIGGHTQNLLNTTRLKGTERAEELSVDTFLTIANFVDFRRNGVHLMDPNESISFSNPLHKFFYRFRPDDEFLLDTIDKAIGDRALWMTPLSTQNDLTEASVAVRSVEQSKEEERTYEAGIRFMKFFSNSVSVAKRRQEVGEEEITKWMNAEAQRSFGSDICIRLLSAPESELPKLIEEARSKLRSACFATDPLSQSMWSYHASSNTGICLEYEYVHDRRFIFKLPGMNPVEYSADERALDRYDIWETLAYLAYAKSIEPGIFSISSNSDPRVFAARKLFLTKSAGWSWQEEFRVVDFGDTSGYAQWPKLKLKKVIFGPQTRRELVDDITRRFAGRLLFERAVHKPGDAKFQIVSL